MIPVVKPYLPCREKLDKYIDGIYERSWLTNNGPLVQELTARLEKYLGVEHLLLVANGTLALQVAYRALGVSDPNGYGKSEAITTPFTFVATASSLKWDGVQPVFVDIDPETWCINPEYIEKAVTQKTKAIVPVHVFGNACEVELIDELASKKGLKTIYDASHAFGVKYKGNSLLKHGDAATLSFHATKLFHTGEGGAIVFKEKEDFERASMMINFGLAGPECVSEVGINAKMSELQAAMGLCVLDEMESNLKAREKVWRRYEAALGEAGITLQQQSENVEPNYSYFPVLFDSEKCRHNAQKVLSDNEINARRYFYPSLDSASCLDAGDFMEISADVSRRILCLPIYSDLTVEQQEVVLNLLLSQSR